MKKEGRNEGMYKLITLFVVSVLWSNVVFAQMNSDATVAAVVARQEAYWKKVDATAEWGKWLVNEFKPYWEKIGDVNGKQFSELKKIEIVPRNGPPMSDADISKAFNAVQKESYKALQNITPPEDVKAYHASLLKGWDLLIQLIEKMPQGKEKDMAQAEMDQSDNEGKQEIIKVFKSHGVPQDMIDDFNKTPWMKLSE